MAVRYVQAGRNDAAQTQNHEPADAPRSVLK